MKLFNQIAIVFVILITTQSIKAQPSSGDFLLAGSVFGTYNKDFHRDTFDFSTRTSLSARFNPKIGGFITNRIAVGGFINIVYSETKHQQTIDDTIKSTLKNMVSKTANFILTNGGFLSYYLPISQKLFWVNTFTYQTGYNSNGISLASFISEEAQTFGKSFFSQASIQTSLQYYFKPHLSLTAEVNALLLHYTKRTTQLELLDVKNTLTIGINYLIQSDDE